MLRSRVRIPLLMLVFCCLLSSGCIEAEVFSFVRYEPKDDSFHCLQVYTNINTPQKADLAHLESLWKRRESIIIQPMQIVGLPGFERKGKDKCVVIDLGDPMAKNKEVATKVDLDSIKVMPGEFYLNTHGNLGYYQQISVPGKAIDAFLKELTPVVAELLLEPIEQQAKLIGNNKAKRLTWDEVRKTTAEELLLPADTKNPKKKDDEEYELLPLEKASWEMLTKACKDETIPLSRKGDVFVMTLPLTKKDCTEVIATFDFIRKQCDERLKQKKPVEFGIPEALEAIKLKYFEGPGLEISIDTTKAARALLVMQAEGAVDQDGKVNFDPAPIEGQKMGCKDTVASIQGLGIAINKKLSIKETVQKFTGK
jgi:hypothetical protein